ncbi:protein STRUBBELIG-RECEPTOR FAMILY 2-like [Rutidosis leptorrhynchoides]|uniref:protein STRUBBELIG-RECEPTOR FAMILY 2-like n=1 Tax=Rutidosis leptorrhynchoides TaxID=125765 RepID=UPI003A990C7F
MTSIKAAKDFNSTNTLDSDSVGFLPLALSSLDATKSNNSGPLSLRRLDPSMTLLLGPSTKTPNEAGMGSTGPRINNMINLISFLFLSSIAQLIYQVIFRAFLVNLPVAIIFDDESLLEMPSVLVILTFFKALQDLYRSFNSPPQLEGWKSSGGDPCQEAWTGVSCSGTSVIQIKLDNLNITGILGYQLDNFRHLRQLDVSNNNIYGEIPYDLPLNLTHLNLACNNLSQYIPYSLSSLKYLRQMNLSHNYLTGPVGNVFTGLTCLKEMDLSYNQFIGDLPSSFGTLKGLLRLFLQHNEFTGSVIFLAGLQLTDLNIQENHFSGIIPKQFQYIHNLWIGGNMFDIGGSPAWDLPLDNPLEQQNITTPPSPPSTESSAVESYPMTEPIKHAKKKTGTKIAVIIVGIILFAACLILYTMHRLHKHGKKLRRPESSDSSQHSLPVSMARDNTSTVLEESPEVSFISSPATHVKHVAPVRNKVVRVNRRRSFAMRNRMHIGAKLYTVAELELATNSFNRTNFLGEGSLGTVFRAEFPDGQVFAVKCISTVVLSLHEEQQFLEVIWTASRLRHPNIITLHGYCVEQGQHMLVYEYVRSLSLDHALHSEAYMPLSWGLRLRIALGIARALNYMHSTCVPSVAHRNLKASNVLLDEDLTPRICDCGLAVLKPLTINSAKAEASETDSGGIVSEHVQPLSGNLKDDIYAFGVLLLELLTGKKPFDGLEPKEENSLVQWASTRLHDNESLNEMVEPALRKTIPPKVLSRFADIVSLCTQAEKGFRPSVSEILESLTRMQDDYHRLRTTADTDLDTYERSFRSTRSRFLASPTMSYVSI